MFRSEDIAIKSRSRRNRTNAKVSWSQFFGGTTPTVLRQIVSAIYRPPLGKGWSISVCRCPSAKFGNEVESRINVGWGKNGGPV